MAPCQTICIHMDPPKEIKFQRPTFNRKTFHTGTSIVAKHIEGINSRHDRGDPSRTRRTREVPFIAGCSHFTRKNARFRAPASSLKHSPCNIHAAITMRFAASRGKPAPIYARAGPLSRCIALLHIPICVSSS